MRRLDAPFRSFLMGGFECSTHRRRDGRRLDVIAATGHDQFAYSDYRTLAEFELRTLRDGLRWHLIDRGGQHDFSSVVPMIRAARAAGVQVIWDLFHYGWPDDLDIFSAAFVRRFAAFARAFAGVLKSEGVEPWVSPVNEISFVSWAGGDVGYLNPFARGRGADLKRQLVRSAIAAMDAVRSVLPFARFVHCEPAIHIVAHPFRPYQRREAERLRLFMFEALDMLAGVETPSLGGGPEYLDVIGLNYYPANQWIHKGRVIEQGERLYRPLRRILSEFYDRYRAPLFIAETGCEDSNRPAWFHYVCDEVHAAREADVPVHGVCLYPILNHPGWDNDRHCHNGLLDYADTRGQRQAYEPLAAEVRRQQKASPSKELEFA